MTDSAERPTDEMTGRTLGDFVVRELIGQGGFGAVYRAEQPLLEREAVIKVIARQAQASEASIARFLGEARLASQLDHPYAAHIYAFGAEPDGLQWIAMELVRGSTLAELIEVSGPLPLERFVPLFDRISEVVHTAHEQGIVHRDIKPENIMVLSRAGRYLPKLLDLGIAKAAGDGEEPALAGDGAPTQNVAVTMSRPGMLGTPRYMAPELWFAPQTAGATVDQYALGAVAFEALTGDIAFPGESLEAVAMSHAKKPPPRLPETFPEALADALVKAMGKRPGNRFESALELGRAVRVGSGIEIKRVTVPPLEPELLADITGRYPRPIVDAVAAYSAAHNAFQARDGVRSIVAAVTRYLGVLALQCRSRLGDGGGHAPRAAELLVELRRGGLGDREWIELVTDVCRPFARRPDTFPLPELPLWLFPTREPQTARDPLSELFDQSGVLDGTVGSADAILAAISDVTSALDGLLRSIAFLADYPLVVPRGERAEEWMGVRQRVAASRPRTGPSIEDGRAVLEDKSGAPILSLWPLVQIREPTPGDRDELFLFEGASRRGARLIAWPIGFEIADEDLWQWFARELIDVDRAGDESSAERAPYLGMSTFASEDAENFFGREREIDAVANRLRTQAFVAVVGPSGAGKSSFLHAGVIPALADYRCLSLRPGATPLANLIARLERDGFEEATLAEIVADPLALGAQLRADAKRRGPLLVLVDQFEEVFTMCRDEEERSRFVGAVCAAARDAADPVRIALTLRDDFLMMAEREPELRPRLARGLQLLGTPAPADLHRIIVEPARRAGYRFEDQAIVREMVEAVADLPGALPLLSFTASRLWTLRDRHFKQLPTNAYRSLGGVVGALAQHAEDTLAEMTAAETALVRKAFRNLVTAEGTRAQLTRQELRDVVGGGDDAEPVIEKLVSARILVASEAERGEVMIEVVHEALLSAWPRLVEWRREDAEGARLRDQLRAAARQWEERGRPSGLLWRDDALTELTLWRSRFPGELPALDAAFAEASRRDALRGRRLRQALVLVAFVALAVGLVVLFRASRAAQRSADDSQQRLIALMAEQGRQAHLDGRPLEAILYLNRAYQLGADGVGLRYMASRSIAARERELFAIAKHPFWGLAYSPSGEMLAASDADGAISLIEAKSGTVIASFKEPTVVNDVSFSADGKRLLSLAPYAGVAVWDVETRTKLLGLEGLVPWIASASLSSDGEVVVVADSAAVVAYRVLDGERLWTRSGEPFANVVAFSPDDSRVAIGDTAGNLEVRQRSGELVGASAGHIGDIAALDWTSDGQLIATAGVDKTVRIWDARAVATLRSIRQPGVVVSIRFSPDGKVIVPGGRFETTGLYEVATGEELVTLRGHTGYVNLGRFTPDGREVVTASQDGTVRLWGTARGNLIATFAGHTGFVWNVAVDPVASRFASASWDTTVRIWNRDSRQLVAFIDGLVNADYHAPTDRILSSGPDSAKLSSGRSGQQQHVLGPFGEPPAAVALTADSAFVAVGATVYGFDAATGVARGSFEASAPVSAIVADEHVVAALDVASEVSLATVSDCRVVARHAFGDAARKVLALAPGNRVAVAGAGLTLLSVPELNVVAELGEDTKAEIRSARSLDFSRDGQRVAIGAEYSELWRLSGEKELTIETVAPALMIRFSPSGAEVATVTMDGGAAVYNAVDGTLLRRLDGHRGGPLDVVFSADGKLILTASTDRTARLWDAEQLRLVDVLAAHSGAVNRAWFSADRSRAILAGEDGVAIFDISSAIPDRAALESYVDCRIDKELGAQGIVPRTELPAHCADR